MKQLGTPPQHHGGPARLTNGELIEILSKFPREWPVAVNGETVMDYHVRKGTTIHGEDFIQICGCVAWPLNQDNTLKRTNNDSDD